MEDVQAPSVTVAHHIQFVSLAKEVLERICATPSKKGKEDRVRKSFQHFRKAFKETYGTLDPEKANVRITTKN